MRARERTGRDLRARLRGANDEEDDGRTRHDSAGARATRRQ